MKFHRLKKTEIPRILNLVAEHYPKSYQKVASRDIQAMFTGIGNKPSYLAAEEKGVVIGFGGYCESWMDTGVCEVFWINVTNNAQGKGVGTEIVLRLLKKIKQKNYKTILLTTTLPQFYIRLGFKELHRIPRSKYVIMIRDVT